MRCLRYSREKGFTLAEAMLATVILGIAAAGVLMPFVAGTSMRNEGQRRTLAAKLAADLMEQVIAEDYDDVISNFNYSEAQGQIKDVTGAIFSDEAYANFSREVSSNKVHLSVESGSDSPVFILATVKVYYSGTEIVSVNRLISK